MSQIVCADTRIFTFHLSDTVSFDVRSIVDGHGEPWFVASGVCAALGVGNVSAAISRLDPDESALISIEASSANGVRQTREVNAVNESGLYSLILSSRKPEAKPFKKWVTSEVLPSLRKTGKYAMPSAQAPAELSRMDILKLAMESEEARIKAEAQLAIAAPKAEALDRIATPTEGAVCLRVAAKLLQMPEKQFLQFANAKGFIFRNHRSRIWQGYSDKAKAGLVELKLTTVERGDGSSKTVEQALITHAGIAKLAQMLGRGGNC